MNHEKALNYFKKNYVELVLVILLIPLFFINVSSYHDWGDDFAQYLDQSKQFISGAKNTQNAVVNYEDICPSHRGSGFSLLLAPVYAIFGHHIPSFLVFISLFYVGTALLVLYFYKKNLERGNGGNQYVIGLMVLALFYNYNVLKLKILILPVFIFSFFIYLIFLIHQVKNKTIAHWLGLAIITGLLISIRNLGWCMYLAILIFHFWQNRRDIKKPVLIELAVLFMLPILISSLIKIMVVGQANYDNVFWYESVFSLTNIKTTVFNNLTAYFSAVQYIFEQEVWGWLNVIMKSALSFLFILGMLNKFIKKFEVFDLFFVLYLLVLILYPYDKVTYRFLFPLLPLIFLYIWHGIKSLHIPFTTKAFALGFFGILFISNYVNVKAILQNPNSTHFGPESEEAQDAFSYIEDSIAPSDVVAYCKPSAMHYYANRKSLFVKVTYPFERVQNLMERHGVSTIIVCIDQAEKGVCNPTLNHKLMISNQFQETWRNKKFVVFKKRL